MNLASSPNSADDAGMPRHILSCRARIFSEILGKLYQDFISDAYTDPHEEGSFHILVALDIGSDAARHRIIGQ